MDTAGAIDNGQAQDTALASMVLLLSFLDRPAEISQLRHLLGKGSQLKFKVNVTRNPAYAGEVKLTCEKLPAGVTTAEVVLKPDQSEAELVLTAAADAAAALASEVILRASSPAEAKISSTIPLPAFSVQ